MKTLSRDRRGAQLAIELPPELLQRLKAYADRERRTVASLMRDWVEAGLAGALEPITKPVNLEQQSDKSREVTDLVDLVVSLKEEVSDLKKWRAKQKPPNPNWVDNLRLEIKRKHGKGWIIRQHGITKANPDGMFQLTRIEENRKRYSVVLPLVWRQSLASAAMEWIDGIRRQMEDMDLSFREAFERLL